MFPSLEQKLARYEELEKQLLDPDVLADIDKMLGIQKEMGGLAKIATAVREYHTLEGDIEAAQMMVDEETDADSKAYAKEELDGLIARRDAMAEELEDLATSGDSITRGSCIMEIRAGTGGDEAALFAKDLYDMYMRYCEQNAWKVELLEFNATELGGIKEAVCSISGEGAFHSLQFESGGHRVQRVPETETQGRVHTSAATVAVLPEATDIEVEIDPEDLQIDTMRAGGPGGQKVNKTESAVRMTHLPTGIVVKIQDEKSQHKNRAKAMRVLKSRILEARQDAVDAERAEARRTLVGSGDRSQRIRTYNFPQNRITDHRCGLSIHKLDRIIQGEMTELIDGLLEFDRQERLKGNAKD
ncbi:peptide chain release factor 1 [Fuerstiella marisgermanici]|uniref:Peptide chain release factor 1 n=1 Tax=Fuerstiella marisgermanici TaxID=1891926 RepID=A0A1P8WBB6_9PLAN|nr:peptide chain release factor 1 [Fuerstiella marisgermanici]APZ91364.1 Peptide chain release factor 1 [Fuerstiella marisgermanici]